jgi:hydroxymethylglutaryl-CoA reductase (NADPH)
MITPAMIKTRSASQQCLRYVLLIPKQLSQHLVLTTFIFPDSSVSHLAPRAETVPVPSNVTVRAVPPTANLLSPISHDSSLAFSVPWSEVSDFLTAAQEIRGELEQSKDREDKIWIMKAARSNGYGSRRTYRFWLSDGWTSFVDLIKVKLNNRFQDASLIKGSTQKLSTSS